METEAGLSLFVNERLVVNEYINVARLAGGEPLVADQSVHSAETRLNTRRGDGHGGSPTLQGRGGRPGTLRAADLVQ